MGNKPAKSGQGGKGKARKRSATAGRTAKPWRSRARLDLLPLEPQIAKMVIQRTPPEVIAAWVRAQGWITVPVPGEEEPEVSRGPYADVTDEQVAECIRAIKARWRAVRDEPETVADEGAAHAVMLDAAIHDAWNRPVMVYDKDAGGFVPLRGPDGTAVVQADHKALAAYMRERREFYGFGAPQKHVHGHVHVHGVAPPPAAMSPADREAELRALLERRAAALAAAGTAPPPVIDVEAKPADERRALPPGPVAKQRGARKRT